MERRDIKMEEAAVTSLKGKQGAASRNRKKEARRGKLPKYLLQITKGGRTGLGRGLPLQRLDSHKAVPEHGSWLLIMLKTLWKSPRIKEYIRTSPQRHHSVQAWWHASVILRGRGRRMVISKSVRAMP